MRTHTLIPFLALALSFGCKSKDVEETDTNVTIGDADTDSDTDTDTDTDTDADTDTTPTECWIAWDGGTCFDTTACPLPTSPGGNSLAFLNQCSDAAYSAFDNAARIPATTWVPGTALPTL
jgi:hypothetical protein